MSVKKLFGTMAAGVLLGALSAPVYAQPDPAQPAQPGNNQGNNQGNRGGGRFDPAQMRQRMAERMKEMLGSTDEEWQALQPKLDKVQEVQRQLQSGRGALFRRQGGGGGNNPAPDQPTTEVGEKTKDLQTTLDNKEAKPDDIKAKLAALRDAKTKARADLTKAQAELKEIVTVRQEAVLVELGLLD